jgi:hypothetical protein
MKVLDSPVAFRSEFRIARRGFARSDADYVASLILENILSRRFRSANPDAFVLQEAHFLPGVFFIGSSSKLQPLGSDAGNVGRPNSDDDWDSHLERAITKPEFEAARQDVLNSLAKKDTATDWLDADTFKLTSPRTDAERAAAVTMADVQRVLENLKKQPAAYVNVFSREKKAAEAGKLN